MTNHHNTSIPESKPMAAGLGDYAATLEALPVEAILLDSRGRVVCANSRWIDARRSAGVSDDVLQMMVGSKLSGEILVGTVSDARDVRHAVDSALAVGRGESESFLGTFRSQTAALGTTAVQIQVSVTNQGRLRRVLLTRSDVPETRSLQVRCEELHIALQRTTEFVFFVDPLGSVTFANERLRRAVDHPREAWSELMLWDLSPDFDADQWRACLEELRELGTLAMTSSLVTREGVTFPVELTASYFHLGYESVFFYGQENVNDTASGSFRFRQKLREKTSRLEAFNSRLQDEMATRAEAESKLRESQERLELVIWACKLGLWDWQLGSGRLSLDHNAVRLLGWTDSCALGTMDELRGKIHRDDLVGFDNSLERHLRGETEQLGVTHRMVFGTGEYRWYYLQGRAVDRNEEGLAERMIGTIQDVSERKTLEEELLHAQKMEAVGRLAGGVAHDFNNLLTAINGYSDLVLRTLDVESPHYRRIEEVRKAGQRATVLTNRLLTFGRKQVLQPEPLELGAVLRALKPLLVPAVGEGVELLLELMTVPFVRADLHQVEQAVLNLVVNARDAMAEGGQITISVSTESVIGRSGERRPHVRVTVRDQGSGIADEIRGKIFEPFFTTKGSGDGSGLGLPMVYGVVQQSDGYIDVESKLGKGTAFHLFFPTVEESLDSSVELLRAHHRGKAPGECWILVVEDEEAVRELVVETLQDDGHSVVAVSSAAEALEAVANAAKAFDLLLTDVVLGGLNGVELARMLRESRPDLPVLFVSGYSENALTGDLDLDRKMGFLRKPFRAKRLYEQVNRLLS